MLHEWKINILRGFEERTLIWKEGIIENGNVFFGWRDGFK